MPAIIVDDVTFNFSDARLYRHMSEGIQIVLHRGGSFTLVGDENIAVLVNPHRLVKFDSTDAPELELNADWVRAIVKVLDRTNTSSLIPAESNAAGILAAIEKADSKDAKDDTDAEPAETHD